MPSEDAQINDSDRRKSPGGAEWAKYENLLKTEDMSFPKKGLAVTSLDGRFIHISPMDQQFNAPFNKQPIGKFHLSVDPQDLPKAWDLIADRVIAEDVAVKVITPKWLEHVEQSILGAKGKNIVIYFNEDNVGDQARWQGMMSDIEKTFAENGIRPGPETISSDRKIPGSKYIHLEHGDGKYDAIGNAVNKWDDGLHGKPDPFKDLKVAPVDIKSPAVAAKPLEEPHQQRKAVPDTTAGHEWEKVTRTQDGKEVMRLKVSQESLKDSKQ